MDFISAFFIALGLVGSVVGIVQFFQSIRGTPRRRIAVFSFLVGIILIVTFAIMSQSGNARSTQVNLTPLPTAIGSTPTQIPLPTDTPTPTATPTVVTKPTPTPTQISYLHLSSAYQGTGYNITVNETGNLLLSSITEDQQGNISGQVTWGYPLIGNGPFSGTISTSNSIHFTSTATDGSGFIITFTGMVNLQNNSMSGSYKVYGSQLSQPQLGTWQVSAIS